MEATRNIPAAMSRRDFILDMLEKIKAGKGDWRSLAYMDGKDWAELRFVLQEQLAVKSDGVMWAFYAPPLVRIGPGVNCGGEISESDVIERGAVGALLEGGA